MSAFKKRYPFSLGTTSFIFPEDWVGNARKLAPIVDEIEILVFESDPDTGLPDAVTIERLRKIGRDGHVVYNVHLPTDVQIGDSDPSAARFACRRIASAVRRTAPLEPVAWILHLARPKQDDGLEAWERRMGEGLLMIEEAAGIPLQRFCIETLDYSPECLVPLADRFQTGICLDVGHAFVHDWDAGGFFRVYRDRVPMMHLHGVHGNRDHLSLDRLNAFQSTVVRDILEHYTGHVSIEVFRETDLMQSLAWLEEHMMTSC